MLTSVLEVVGLALIVAGVVVLLGLGGALASAGGVLLLAAWLLERRG